MHGQLHPMQIEEDEPVHVNEEHRSEHATQTVPLVTYPGFGQAQVPDSESKTIKNVQDVHPLVVPESHVRQVGSQLKQAELVESKYVAAWHIHSPFETEKVFRH